MALANIIQAIPSMALLGFMIPLLGIGTKPAIVMVILYSLLPIIKNTVTGLDNINGETLEAAKGIGLNRFSKFYIKFRFLWQHQLLWQESELVQLVRLV